MVLSMTLTRSWECEAHWVRLCCDMIDMSDYWRTVVDSAWSGGWWLIWVDPWYKERHSTSTAPVLTILNNHPQQQHHEHQSCKWFLISSPGHRRVIVLFLGYSIRRGVRCFWQSLPHWWWRIWGPGLQSEEAGSSAAGGWRLCQRQKRHSSAIWCSSPSLPWTCSSVRQGTPRQSWSSLHLRQDWPPGKLQVGSETQSWSSVWKINMIESIK